MTKALERESFPVVEVKNRVLWVNPEIHLPFNIAIGESSDFGVFVTNPERAVKPRLHLSFENVNHRAGLLGEIIITDSQGNTYHDLDLKGVGYVTNPKGKNVLQVYRTRLRGKDDTWGTWRSDKAEREKEITEFLVRNGVRTYRIAAIIELREIALPTGEIITIEKAKNIGAININETPVIGLRIYRDRERIRHQDTNTTAIFNRAKSIVERELKQSLTWEEYLIWFAQTLGGNLFKIHSIGYWHGWVSPHNVTLACEIIDFGFGEGSKKMSDLPFPENQQCKERDFVGARDTLNVLFRQLVKAKLISATGALVINTFDAFENAYNKYD